MFPRILQDPAVPNANEKILFSVQPNIHTLQCAHSSIMLPSRQRLHFILFFLTFKLQTKKAFHFNCAMFAIFRTLIMIFQRVLCDVIRDGL